MNVDSNIQDLSSSLQLTHLKIISNYEGTQDVLNNEIKQVSIKDIAQNKYILLLL